MIARIKQNRLLHHMLRKALTGRLATRRYPGNVGALTFPADQHLNLFLSRRAVLEENVTANLAHLIDPGDLVFDVGANIGYYTVLFSRWVAHGKVIAVEPDTQNYPILVENLRRNDLKNVCPVPKAVSACTRTAIFFRDTATGRSSSLEKTAWHPERTEIMPVTVTATTIDQLADEFGKPTLIKCDVEGHEVTVLQGAAKTLRSRPILMLEVKGENQHSVGEMLRWYGYLFHDADRPLMGVAPMEKLHGFNILALTAEHCERFQNVWAKRYNNVG